MRINDGLADVLREFKEKASAIGVKQFIIQTHFQTPLEVTPEAKEAIRKILSAGWIITISWYIRWLLHVEGIRPGFVRCSFVGGGMLLHFLGKGIQ